MSLQFTTNLGFIPYTTGPGFTGVPGGGHGEPLQEAVAAVAQCQGRHVAPGSPLDPLAGASPCEKWGDRTSNDSTFRGIFLWRFIQ